MNYPEISRRAFNSPLLVEPRKAAAFMRGLGPRLLSVDPEAVASALAMSADDDPDWSPPPYASLLGDDLGESMRLGLTEGYAIVDGVAVIPITGVLVHRGAWIGNSSGQTSYEGIRAALEAAVDDPAVQGIALEIDCFGGEVSGCFDLADYIRALGQQKPIRAFVAENAYSAAYAIAAQAERIIVPRTGGVGSIGVLTMHVDVSGAMKKEGVQISLIHAGEHKVDGHPYAALPEDVRAEWEAEMEGLRRIFAETVAAGRAGKLDAAGALATEARCFTGADAVAAGLADAVMEPQAAFYEFLEEINSGADAPSTSPAKAARAAKGDQTMASMRSARYRGKRAASGEGEDALEEDDPTAMEPEDEPDGDETDGEPDGDETDGEPDGDEEDEPDGDEPTASARRERKRISSILNAKAAVGREGLANHYAFNTNQSAKAAIAAMKAAPKAVKGGGGSRLSKVMGAEHANLKPAGGASPRGVSAADRMAKRFPKK